MDTPLRKRFSTPELKNFLDELNAETTIGPYAPGDGDIIQWYSTVCLLGVGQMQRQEWHENESANHESLAKLSRIVPAKKVKKCLPDALLRLACLLYTSRCV